MGGYGGCLWRSSQGKGGEEGRTWRCLWEADWWWWSGGKGLMVVENRGMGAAQRMGELDLVVDFDEDGGA